MASLEHNALNLWIKNRFKLNWMSPSGHCYDYSRGTPAIVPSRYNMMTSWTGNIFALLDLCAEISPITGEFPAERPVTRSCGVFFDLRLNKWLSKQSWGCWFVTPLGSLWRHCNEITRYRCNNPNTCCADDMNKWNLYLYFYHSVTPVAHSKDIVYTRWCDESGILIKDRQLSKCHRHRMLNLVLHKIHFRRRFLPYKNNTDCINCTIVWHLKINRMRLIYRSISVLDTKTFVR